MNIKEATIKDMADFLLIGNTCFLHSITGDFEHYPTEVDLLFDEENPWQEIIDKVENNRSDYIRIDPMDSHRAFTVMATFAEELEAGMFREKLFNALNRPKPFSHFNHLIHQSDFRQAWFNFRQEKYEAWVKEQIADHWKGE